MEVADGLNTSVVSRRALLRSSASVLAGILKSFFLRWLIGDERTEKNMEATMFLGII